MIYKFYNCLWALNNVEVSVAIFTFRNGIDLNFKGRPNS